MSLKLMAQVWEHPYLRNTMDKLVASTLADFADDGGMCRFLIVELAKRACLTQETTRGVMNILQEFGFLTLHHAEGESYTCTLHLASGRQIQRPRKAQRGKSDASEVLRPLIERSSTNGLVIQHGKAAQRRF